MYIALVFSLRLSTEHLVFFFRLAVLSGIAVLVYINRRRLSKRGKAIEHSGAHLGRASSLQAVNFTLQNLRLCHDLTRPYTSRREVEGRLIHPSPTPTRFSTFPCIDICAEWDSRAPHTIAMSKYVSNANISTTVAKLTLDEIKPRRLCTPSCSRSEYWWLSQFG